MSFLTISGVIASLLDSAMAQITPDATLGTESSVVIPNSDSTESISGGATRGANLFHSFEQFSVPPGGAAYFNNTLNIQNIISRVTGTSISNIDGLIQANGTANLFLLNPNGIIFGPNARLNIGGSFLGSTASSINFADGTQFNAKPQSIPLLIVSVPVGLSFGSNPGRILVQGDGQGARTTAELIDTTSGLRVRPDETLALVGRNIALEGATLKTSGGRIELGSVAGSGLVSITPTGKGWELGYTGISTFENIQLSQQASVDASGTGGGDVQVRGRQISITDGSQIEASTLRQEPGGTVNITSLDLVELIGESADGRLISAIATQVYPGATGTGGNLNIETGRLIVRDGAQISAGTFGRGNAGFLAVRTSDSVEVTGTTVDFISSGLFSQVSPRASGSGGNLTIETGRLIVRDGAQISAGTSSRGSAGSLSISARNSVEVSGTPERGRIGSTISTSVEPRATGNGGDLTLETQRLIVRDGATVSSATFGGGRGGTLSVKVEESIELIGSSASGIPSGLSARTGGAGNAGNLNIETGRLSVWDGARVTVNSLDSGTAGRLELKASEIYLNNQGTISAETALSEGGDIALQSQDIQLRNNSAITTTAQGGTGSGGNINIDTDTLVTLENSDITANAVQGQGGNIQVNTQGIFRSLDSNITAESGIGLNGVVDIRTLGFDVTNTLTPLAGNLVSTEQIVANSCLTRHNASSGSFVITGSGGLPTDPYSGIEEWDTYPETQMPQAGVQQQFTLDQKTITAQHKWKVGDPIVEAQGIVKTSDGRTLLGMLPQGAVFQAAQSLICPAN